MKTVKIETIQNKKTEEINVEVWNCNESTIGVIKIEGIGYRLILSGKDNFGNNTYKIQRSLQ